MKIKKGNLYLCTETVVMDSEEIAYYKNNIYKSDADGCITDVQGYTEHCWDTNEVSSYFIPFTYNLDTKNSTSSETKEDMVNHPPHYTKHPSGVECIDITMHYDFCIGNAIKYLWRSGLKQEEGISNKDKEIEDINKAIWYLQKKIEILKN